MMDVGVVIGEFNDEGGLGGDCWRDSGWVICCGGGGGGGPGVPLCWWWWWLAPFDDDEDEDDEDDVWFGIIKIELVICNFNFANQ